jgi:hypothetical protein
MFQIEFKWNDDGQAVTDSVRDHLSGEIRLVAKYMRCPTHGGTARVTVCGTPEAPTIEVDSCCAEFSGLLHESLASVTQVSAHMKSRS